MIIFEKVSKYNIWHIYMLFIEPRTMYIALELQITVAIKNGKKKWSRLYWNSTVFPTQKLYTASFLVPPYDQCMRKERGKRPLRTQKMVTPPSKQLFNDTSPQGSSSTLLSCPEVAQSCPTLCNPTDGSPTVSPIPGILQARIQEWVAISFSLRPY